MARHVIGQERFSFECPSPQKLGHCLFSSGVSDYGPVLGGKDRGAVTGTKGPPR
jgi:hypothetical protein